MTKAMRSVLLAGILLVAFLAAWNAVLFVRHGEAINFVAVLCCACSGSFCAYQRRGLR